MNPWALEEAARLLGRDARSVQREIEEAMWAGDVDTLCELASCRCCCHEHTFLDCPARTWEGCRGSGSMTRAEEESWARHYEHFHGMTRDEFYGNS